MFNPLANWRGVGPWWASLLRNRVLDFEPNPRWPELQDPVYYGSPRALALDQRAVWALTDLQMSEFVSKLFKAARKRSLPMYVHTAWRSPDLQQKLYAGGQSQVRSGPHQRGAAVDIVHAHYNWNAPDEFWRWIGRQGEEIIRANGYDIEWGGNFRTLYDPAHWQLKDWRKRKNVSDGAMFDRDTGEVITWYRSPFSKKTATPKIAGEDYYQYLEKVGRKWKTSKN